MRPAIVDVGSTRRAGEGNELEYDEVCEQVIGDVQVVVLCTVHVEGMDVKVVAEKMTEGSSR